MNKKSFKIIFIVILAITFLACALSVVLAKQKPPVRNSLTLKVNEDVIVSYAENKFIILRERLSLNKYKITVIDKNSYKIVKKYNLDFGRKPRSVEWHGSNGDTVPDNRFFIVYETPFLGEKGPGKPNFLVDVITGTVRSLPNTSAGLRIYPSPSNKAVLYQTWDNGSYGVQNIATGKRIDNIVPIGEYAMVWRDNAFIEPTRHPAWNKDGQYLAFTKDGSLQLLDISKMQTVNLGGTENIHFIEWTPSGKGFFYEAAGYLRYFQLGQPVKNIGEINNKPGYSRITVSFNHSGQKAAILCDSDKMYLYDMTTSVYKAVYKPTSTVKQSDNYFGTTWDVIWGKDDKDVIAVLESETWAYAYNKMYYYDNDEKWKEINHEVQNPRYYKNYLLFLTDLEIMPSNGMGPKPGRARKLAVYNLVTKQMRIIDNITNFNISPDNKKVFVYKADEQPDVKGAKIYLLDEYNWKIGSEIPGFRRNGYQLTGGIINIPSSLNGPVRYFDYTKVQIRTLFTVPQKQLCFPFGSQNTFLFVLPDQKRIYIFDGHRFKTSTVKDIYLKSIWPYKAAPALVNVSPDEKDYCYLALIKRKTYLKINRI